MRISETKHASHLAHKIKFYAVEIAGTILFVVLLARFVWHELGF